MNAFLPICKKGALRIRQKGRSLLLLAALGLPALAHAQTPTATFPRSATFNDANTSGFTLGGTAFLTAVGSSASGGTPIDASGSGALRLTDAIGYQAGYAIDNTTFATPNGFSISFEFFSYGSTSKNAAGVTVPADGFSIFLVDGAGTDPGAGQFKIGGVGGSLGYAPNTNTSPSSPGVTKGYIGIGLDEFGNYSNPSEGRTGGPGAVANVIALRGDYTNSYKYLTGTSTGTGTNTKSTLGTTLTVSGTTRTTTATDPNYRKAYINVVPTTTNGVTIYKITIRVQNGQSVTTAINSFTVTNPPPTLRVGFGASTGGSNAIHEIRALTIVQAPIAVDDYVQTPYNKPITFSALANDLNGGGSNIDPATVDLNPNTIGNDNSFPTSQGTFTVDNTGVVTFTPIGTFSGTVSIPYTVQNTVKDISNLGNITVVVTGADVETVVSGPTSVNPGAISSYTVTTSNNGVETATNVQPKLALPSGFTVSGSLPTGATSVISGGITTITFASITLTARQSTTNTLKVTASTTTGSYSLTSNYSYPSGAVVPDAVMGNNTSTLNVAVQGQANIASVCAVPGKDGPLTLGASDMPNTYYAGITAAKGSKTIVVSTTPTGNSATPIAAGDLLLIMQMQGATMTLSSTKTDVNYGTVNSATAGTNEYVVAASTVDASGNLKLLTALSNNYTTVNATSASTPFQQFQVVRVPQYSTLTLNGTVKGLAWNGKTGGILALEVAGNTDFTTGTLNMDGAGFRGGAGIQNVTGGTNDIYVAANSNTGSTIPTATLLRYASKGESIGGTPYQVYNGVSAVSGGSFTYQNYAIGSFSQGRIATGGGGGVCFTGAASGNMPGGGGGANGGAGGAGQAYGTSNGNAGNGGTVVPTATPTPSFTPLYLGGGGGAGVNMSTSSINFLQSSGSTGGGIIILRSGSVSGTATVSATGNSGPSMSIGAGGGGGGGGTIVLNASTGLGNLTANANGGSGTFSQTNGDGGGGGGGVVISNATLSSNTSSLGGSSNGTAGTSSTPTATATSRTDCTPALVTTLRTTTPNVVRSGSMKATYIYTISNTGAGIMGLKATPNLGAAGGSGLFTYTDNTNTASAVLELTDGTSQPLAAGTNYTIDSSNPNAPVFTLLSNTVLPSGANVAFTFDASIATTAVTGTAYGSNATGSYLNPLRTTTTTATMATPAYNSSNGTSADVVTVVVPLPVNLTKFTVVAAGADAILNWETAQEVNNRYFEVERSLDGQKFESVGTVAGNGNTVLTESYRYTDAGAATRTANVLYYRLRQVDYDGQSSFSPVRTVQFSHTDATVALYPNPTTSSATLDLSQLPAGDYTVQVFETTGRLVQRGTYQPGKQTLPLENLPTGTYFVKVQGASLTKVLPLIKQ
jgi:hypothetical protein